MPKRKAKKALYSCEIQTPILSNPLIWSQSLIAVGSGAAFVLLLLVGLNIYEGNWNQIPSSLLVGLSLFGGMFALYAVAILIMYGGGSTTRYEMDEESIIQYSIYPKKRFGWFRWLGLLGVLSGRSAGYTAAGARLMADSRQVTGVKWQEIDKIKIYPSRGEIRLLSDWRTVVQLFCPAEQFDEVSQWIHQRVVSARSQPQEMPIAHKIFFCFFVLLFGFFLLPELPIRVKPELTLVMILLLSYALWSQGIKRKVASWAALLIAIGSPLLAWSLYGIDLRRGGAGYALALQVIFYLYMMYVACHNLRRTK